MRAAGVRIASALTLAALALTACTSGDARPPGGDPGALGPEGRRGCRGVSAADVRGPRIDYAHGPLADVPGSRAMCAAYWLPGADRRLVPQGLALDGDTAWVSGYHFSPEAGARRCVLTRVSLRTGRRLAGLTPIEGAVGHRDPKACRHGGGLALTREGLWVAETMRLWLLDPDAIGTGRDPVKRVWGIVEPLRGSIMVDSGGRLGLGRFDASGTPQDIAWFDVPDLLAPGVLDLTGDTAGPGQVGPVRRDPGRTWMQGGTVGPDGLYVVRSSTHCGQLLLPGGRRVAVAPGTEDIQLDGRGDLWALSEAGAKTFQLRGGRPLVPMLARYDARALMRGPSPTCDL